MKRARGKIALLIIALLAAGAAGAVYWQAHVLPRPERAGTRQLIRWLIERDIAQQPAEIQAALLVRLESVLLAEGGIAWEEAAQLRASQRARLAANALWLEQRWLYHQAALYAATPAQQQTAFLDEKLPLVFRLGKLDALFRELSGCSASHPHGAGMFGRIEHWIEAAEGPQRDQLALAVRHALLRYLATSDLAEVPPDVREELALRIANHLAAGGESDGPATTPAERDRLHANGWLLARAWAQRQSAVYAELPAAEQAEFLAAQAALVQRWTAVSLEMQRPRGATAPPSWLAVLGVLSQLERCAEEEPPGRCETVRRFTGDLRRWLWGQMLRGWWPS